MFIPGDLGFRRGACPCRATTYCEPFHTDSGPCLLKIRPLRRLVVRPAQLESPLPSGPACLGVMARLHSSFLNHNLPPIILLSGWGLQLSIHEALKSGN